MLTGGITASLVHLGTWRKRVAGLPLRRCDAAAHAGSSRAKRVGTEALLAAAWTYATPSRK